MSNSWIKGLAFFLASLLIFSFLFYRFLPQIQPQTNRTLAVEKAKSLHYLALGDSLTEGVGDTTKQGGFVPLLAEELQSQYDYRLMTNNFGVSGNTSNQILARMTSDETLKQQLKRANLLTVTVGGNDVMRVVQKHITNLKASSFVRPAKAYQKRLATIIEQARKDNPDLPIYIVGIYNPFYVNFPELTAMQDVVNQWNQATQETLASYDKVYFVSINDLLSRGVDNQGNAVTNTNDSNYANNAALFEEDHFHPNNTGYQLIANAVMEKISETHNEWQN